MGQRESAVSWDIPAGPPPKEQPPRNLSGERTAGPGHSGKRPPKPRQRSGHRRGNSAEASARAGESSQVPATEGVLETGAPCDADVPLERRRVAMTETQDSLPLDSWHRALGARMVSFAGYAMPIQYEGIL